MRLRGTFLHQVVFQATRSRTPEGSLPYTVTLIVSGFPVPNVLYGSHCQTPSCFDTDSSPLFITNELVFVSATSRPSLIHLILAGGKPGSFTRHISSTSFGVFSKYGPIVRASALAELGLSIKKNQRLDGPVQGCSKLGPRKP